MSKYSPYILFLLLSLLVVVLALNDFGPMKSYQMAINDFLINFNADNSLRKNVMIVSIDDKSTDEYGKWPWDHDLIADLTAAIGSGEPKAVVLDINLSENGKQEALGKTETLANQLKWVTQAILPYDIALSNYRINKTNNPENLFKNSVIIENPLGIMDENSALQVRKIFMPASKLLAHKPLLGFDYHSPDEDRILRHQPLIMNYEGYYYPSLSLVAAAAFYDVHPNQIKVVEGKEIQIGSGCIIPINNKGEYYINFPDGNPYANFSASDILSEGFSREIFKNKVVLVYYTGNNDELFQTASTDLYSSLSIKASIIENIINKNMITIRTDLSSMMLLALLLIGASCAFMLPRLNMMYRAIILLGGIIIVANVNYLLFTQYNMIVPTVYIVLELLLFIIASPILDSKYLAIETSGSKDKPPVDIKAANTDSKAVFNEWADAPVRTVQSSSSDPENIRTTAIGSKNESSSADSEHSDHQNISLDNTNIGGSAQMDGTMASSEPKKSSKKKSKKATKSKQSGKLSATDAALVAGNDGPNAMLDSQGMMKSIAPTDIKNLGRYQVSGILGKGAMGMVYKGVDPAINRPVALKTIRLDFVNDPDEMEELKVRLHREAQAAGKLSHPNIVTIYDVGSEGSLQYIAMEYLEGQTLEEMIKKKVRFNYRIIAQIISQICHALGYAHERGIVHRDIKPANIMVMSDYRVKVMDYGIARVDSNSMTKTGVAMGTPNYISPEQLKGVEIDSRADIFSLGVVMYEMLLGRRPFKGENITSLMYAIMHTEPEKPSSIRPQIPLLFDHIIGRALKKEPAERYQKSSDIIVDLQDFVESFAN